MNDKTKSEQTHDLTIVIKPTAALAEFAKEVGWTLEECAFQAVRIASKAGDGTWEGN